MLTRIAQERHARVSDRVRAKTAGKRCLRFLTKSEAGALTRGCLGTSSPSAAGAKLTLCGDSVVGMPLSPGTPLQLNFERGPATPSAGARSEPNRSAEPMGHPVDDGTPRWENERTGGRTGRKPTAQERLGV